MNDLHADKQNTSAKGFSLTGKGLHTGLESTVTFRPASDNAGYEIKRIDLPGQPIIDAHAENVVSTNRGTVLFLNGVQVGTVEHALAALYTNNIDNCLIDVDAPEFPILDGSSIEYVNKILECGIHEQTANREYYIPKETIDYQKIYHIIHAAESINNGHISHKLLAGIFSKVFNVDLSDLYSIFLEIRRRENRTEYLHRMIKALEKRMHDLDKK